MILSPTTQPILKSLVIILEYPYTTHLQIHRHLLPIINLPRLYKILLAPQYVGYHCQDQFGWQKIGAIIHCDAQ